MSRQDLVGNIRGDSKEKGIGFLTTYSLESKMDESINTVVRELEERLQNLKTRSKELDQLLIKAAALSSSATTPTLKFFPNSSKCDVSFFKELGEIKLNKQKLNTDAIPIWGTFAIGSRNHGAAWIQVRQDSFQTLRGEPELFPHERQCWGEVINVNTSEHFKTLDKKQLLVDQMARFLQDIESGRALQHPHECLNRFLILTHADLKKHHYLYWFAFPTVNFPIIAITSSFRVKDAFPFGVFEKLRSGDFSKALTYFSFWPTDNGALNNLVRPLSALSKMTDGIPTLGFFDPSPSAEHPGWPLRNLLMLAAHPHGLNFGKRRVQVLCIRDVFYSNAPSDPIHSIVLDIEIPAWDDFKVFNQDCVMGWEPNARDRMGPRFADLGEMLDKTKLSESACNLNLKLMKWRAFPELNEIRLGETNVLLLGAGTLGCAVARGLMGWGIKRFTFCDNGKVSYSNPVRQSLFVAADAPARWKAQVAAERCVEIYPGAQCTAWTGNILMPGHPAIAESAQQEFEKLEFLVKTHDVICLMTDTRESRWLPTVLGAAHDKIVLNAALGFDGFVVMRHGCGPDDVSSSDRLGCYFCSDIVAPRDSTKDRTLDQQCTVTRPGAAPVAGALLVEMLVGILHHPLGNRAPAIQTAANAPNKLGALPHQIRGYLSTFQNDLISGPAYQQCTACSKIVVEEFRKDGFAFVERVMHDPAVLEEITGIRKMTEDALRFEQDDDQDAQNLFCMDDGEFEEMDE